MANDTFVHGQWLKGIVRLCDLSPDGEMLVYWAAQYHIAPGENNRRFPRRVADGDETAAYEPAGATLAELKAFQKRHPKRRVPRYMQQAAGGGARRVPPRANQGSWTAISRPPFFSALAVWPSFGTWTGGGYFRSGNQLVLAESDDGMTPVENVRMPVTFHVSQLKRPDGDLERRMAEEAAAYEEVKPQLLAVQAAVAAGGRRFVDQLEPLKNGALVMAVDGVLYRLADWRHVPPEAAFDRAARLADFNGLSFQMMRPPAEAMRWP
ncbi:MAG: hypothetical protein AB7E80_04810 [Hyphomicrobiaceae bacterium]